jgi:hypothetical protein
MEDNLIYEESVLLKLYHNHKLQEEYLPDLLPGVFTTWKLLAYIMTKFHQKEIEISIENILLVQNSHKITKYVKANRLIIYTEEQLQKLLIDNYNDTSPSLFKEAYDVLLEETFYRYVKTANEDFIYDSEYKNRTRIVKRAKSILKLNNILYSRKIKQREDTLALAIKTINESQSYVPTFSHKLNNIIGGFSKGFIASIAARPSHGKSTIMTWDTIYGLQEGTRRRVDIISAEEPSAIFWRRIISAYFRIPSDLLRLGDYHVTKKQYDELKEFAHDRLFFHSARTLEEVLGTLNTIKNSTIIWLDHVNAVVYPRGDELRGIKSLVDGQKQYLAENPDTVIVDLSQVNTKSMKFNGRLFPTKDDAFGSSVLDQAAREFLTVYYPYLDSIGVEIVKKKKKKDEEEEETPIDRIKVSIEKTSFGGKGVIDLKFINTMGRYVDTKDKQKDVNVILPDNEELNLGF